MRNLYFLLVMVTYLSASSQPYSTFHKNRPAYYNFNSNYITFYQQAAIAIDSFKVIGSDTTFFHSTIIDYDNSNGCDLKAHDTSFVGFTSKRMGNGDDYFFNRANDSIYFVNSASLNQSWVMHHFANGDVMRATVQSIDEVSVLGVSDSVKTIKLQAENNIGNNTSNIFNGKIFKVGKSTGFVSGYSLFHFPEDTIGFSIVGIENPPLGLNTSELTPEKIFDFEVGDRFDYISGWTTTDANTVDFIIHEIIGKQILGNGDSLVYTISFKHYSKSFDYPDYFSGISTGISTEIYVLSLYGWLNSKPFQIYNLGANSDGLQILNESYYNSISTVRITDNYSWMLQSVDCLQSTVASEAAIEKYGSGIGKAYSYGGYWAMNNYDTLVYFNKSGVEWGDSINWAELTGMAEISNENAHKVFPNPSNNYVYLEGNFSFSQTEIHLLNLFGEEVKYLNLIPSSQTVKLDISGLPNGLYILQIQSREKVFSQKVLKN